MTIWLQVLFGVSVLVITGLLVPLLLQARRTAVAVERLADSATRDLKQMAEDMHQTRIRVEGLCDMAQQSLEHPSTLTKVVAGLVGAVPLLFGRREATTDIFQTLLTGLRTALNLFHRPKSESEEECHE